MYRKNFTSYNDKTVNREEDYKKKRAVQKLYKQDKMTLSTRSWINRDIKDIYLQRRLEDGYFSRAAYKLQEIDRKVSLFSCVSAGDIVLDLGCAPGSWLQYSTNRLEFVSDSSVIGVDLQPIRQIEGVDFIQGDFTNEEVQNEIIKLIDGRGIKIILSDMAPSTCGHNETDHLACMLLCETALSFAEKFLVEGGAFVCKILAGGSEDLFVKILRQSFAQVKFIKPDASRKSSSEIYLVAKNYEKSD